MATLAADDTRVRRGAEAPISAHPAFPAIVALWFAALLGLGSLILPAALLERLTAVTGIAALFPAAGPPLGFTDRATIAIGGALVGALLGLVLARQVASGQAHGPRPRFADDARRCRPISAHDELGEEGLDAPAPRGAGSRRRSLAIAEDDAPSSYLGGAPLPGQDEAPVEEPDGAAGDALDLGDFVAEGEVHAEQNDQDFSMTDETGLDPLPDDAPAPDERQEFVPTSRSGADLPRAFDPLPGPDGEFDPEPDAGEALPFSAPSLRRAPAEERAERFPAPMPQPYDPPRTSFPDAEWSNEAEESDFAPGDGALDEPGLVQLATRLGAAIERRRSLRAAPPAPGAGARAVFTAAEDIDAAEAEEAARARADFFGGPPVSAHAEPAPQPDVAPAPLAAPASFHAPRAASVMARSPLGKIDFGDGDDGEEDELAASLSLPLRRRPEAGEPSVPAAFAADGADDTGDEECEDPTAEQEYSSLLAMKNPFRKEAEEFIRVDEPEPDEDDIEATVTFPERKATAESAPPVAGRPFDPPEDAAASRPASAMRNQGDAERELRAALQTLQRMSGAA